MSDIEEPSKTLLEPEADDSLNDANTPEIGSDAARAVEGQNVDVIASDSPVWRGYLRALGPGLITGASDDDPSGIATYAPTGARFGFGMLRVALITFPLMAAVQALVSASTSNRPSSPLRLEGRFDVWCVTRNQRRTIAMTRVPTVDSERSGVL